MAKNKNNMAPQEQPQGEQKQKKAKKNSHIPKDTFESIPYRSVYPNGIIESYDGRFSRSYSIPQANFDTEEEEDQERIFLEYEKVINSFGEGIIGQITVVNRSVDQDIVRNNILMRPSSDGFNDLREEWNDLLLGDMTGGKNNVSKNITINVSFDSRDIIDANDAIRRMDRTMAKNIRKVTHKDPEPVSIKDRLSLLYDIYNADSKLTFDKKATGYIDKYGNLDLKALARQGIYTKYLISPDSFTFNKSFFQCGEDVWGRAFYLDHLPSQLPTSLLDDLSNIPCNMIESITFIPINAAEASNMMKNRLREMNAQISRTQADAAKEGITNAGVVSAELQNAADQAKDLMSDVMKRDQRLFKVIALLVVLAPTKEELERQSKNLKSIVNGHLCQLRTLKGQQEQAFNTALPLAGQYIDQVDRILTTEGASVFIPFSVQDLNQMDGMYYGVNPISGNMIRYNKKNGSNYNSLVLGASGSGKSFLVKEELTQKFLTTDESIIVIDPEGEYASIGRELGGTVVEVSDNSKNHINPLDMDIQYSGQGENPIPMKCAEIETLIESMLGGGLMISPVAKSLIHRVGQIMYRGYYNHMKDMVKVGITCDREASPTLQDFFDLLTKQPEPEAQDLAASIETFCVGNYDFFAHRTNVELSNRLVVYDISKMTPGLKEPAMHVCMSDAWNTTIRNARKGLWTDLYIDEFHLFTKTKSSASFMKDIYKRARKWHGMPTAITQNVSDLFVNDEATALLSNSSFIIMMNQQPLDRATLGDMFHISPALLDFITDQPFGNGLIYNGTTIVPFENEFPKDTRMYELMDSNKKKEEEDDE